MFPLTCNPPPVTIVVGAELRADARRFGRACDKRYPSREVGIAFRGGVLER